MIIRQDFAEVAVQKKKIPHLQPPLSPAFCIYNLVLCSLLLAEALAQYSSVKIYRPERQSEKFTLLFCHEANAI